MWYLVLDGIARFECVGTAPSSPCSLLLWKYRSFASCFFGVLRLSPFLDVAVVFLLVTVQFSRARANFVLKPMMMCSHCVEVFVQPLIDVCVIVE